MSKRIVVYVITAFLVSFGWLAGSPAQAESAAEFYSKNRLTLILGTGAKGSYALHTRVLMKYLTKHIPGHPTVVQQFMPGAGGAKAANYVYNVAAKNGAYVGNLLKYIAVNQAIGRKNLRYDAAKFNWILSSGPINSVVAFWHTANVKTFADLRKKQLVVGSTGRSSETFITPTLLNEILGAKLKIVTGYKGLGSIHLAMETGEVNGRAASMESLRGGKPHWLTDNKVNIVVQTGLEKNYDLPKVPTMVDLATNPSDRALLEFVGSGATLGRIYVAPPGVAVERLAALRAGFEAATRDPGYLADTKKRRLDVAPKAHKELEALVARVLGASPKTIARARKAFGLK